jgi:hypothetical protein
LGVSAKPRRSAASPHGFGPLAFSMSRRLWQENIAKEAMSKKEYEAGMEPPLMNDNRKRWCSFKIGYQNR